MSRLVSLKLATSLDGKIALKNGQSKWITGEAARDQVHHMRATHDAIITAIGTVLADNPQMTARPDGALAGRQPLRVVLDSHLRTPANSAMFACQGDILIIANKKDDAREAGLRAAGADIAYVDTDPSGQLDLNAILAVLEERGHSKLMFEGGGTLACSVIRANLVDRIEWFRAPILLGGDGISVLAELDLEAIDQAPIYERVALNDLGRDVWESYRRVQS